MPAIGETVDGAAERRTDGRAHEGDIGRTERDQLASPAITISSSCLTRARRCQPISSDLVRNLAIGGECIFGHPAAA